MLVERGCDSLAHWFGNLEFCGVERHGDCGLHVRTPRGDRAFSAASAVWRALSCTTVRIQSGRRSVRTSGGLA